MNNRQGGGAIEAVRFEVAQSATIGKGSRTNPKISFLSLVKRSGMLFVKFFFERHGRSIDNLAFAAWPALNSQFLTS